MHPTKSLLLFVLPTVAASCSEETSPDAETSAVSATSSSPTTALPPPVSATANGSGQPTGSAPAGDPLPSAVASSSSTAVPANSPNAGSATISGVPSLPPSGSSSVEPTPSGVGGMMGLGGAGGMGAAGAGNGGGQSGVANLGGGGANSEGPGGVAGVGGDFGVIDPGTEGDGPLPEISSPFMDENLDDSDVPQGTVYSFSMGSEDSQIYPGLNGSYSRDIDVYIPAQYVDGTAAPFIVVQDGPGYTDRMQRALNNLIDAGGAPALIAIMVANGGGDSIGSERGLEYDTMSDVYVNFVDTELLPFVLANEEIRADYPGIALTENPEGRAAMGCSSGAAAAFTMAWFGDDRYRRVLSYSGTFVDQQDPQVATYTNGAWEYHEHLIAEQTPNKPIRVYLEVGENDNGADRDEASLHNWVLANQRMAEVLETKGYHYQYQFALGAGHCDGGAIGQTLYGALEWLWRGYPINP